MSQSLFYWKLFCNELKKIVESENKNVTILVLLEIVLQSKYGVNSFLKGNSHNPCFIGNCSAIQTMVDSATNAVNVTILVLLEIVRQ